MEIGLQIMKVFSLKYSARALGGLALSGVLSASALASGLSQDVSFSRQADVGVELGESLNVGLSLNNPENLAVTYQLLAGPSDLVLDSTTGEIQWTPSALSAETIRVQASVIGDESNVAVMSFNVLVTPELDVDAGLVAHWPLDGAAADIQGEVDGINYGAAPAEGQLASSLSFDGNDFIELNNVASLPTDSLTMSIWAKHGDDFEGNETLISYGEGNRAMRITMEPNPYGYGQPAIRVGSTQRLVVGNVVDPDRWYHIVVTHESGEGVLYIDGQEVRRQAVNWQIDPQQGFIGRRGADYWRGELDDARIYDRALAASEVAELYQSGLDAVAVAPESDEILPVRLPEPLAYYSFDEGTTLDDAGNGFDGTNLGAQPFAEGRFGAAMSFADEAYIELAQGELLPAGNTPRTLMAWTRLDDVNSFGNFVISYGQSNIYGAGRYNQISAAFAAAHVGTNALSQVVRYRTFSQTQGEWVHLAMTYDGAVGRLFIDGREIDAVAGDWSIEPGAVAAIGRLINTGRYWKGDLDEVRVYNQALDPEQIDRVFRNDTVNVDEAPVEVPSVPEEPEVPEVPDAGVIGFDDLIGSEFGIPSLPEGFQVTESIGTGYQGLLWDSFSFTNAGAISSDFANSGFETGIVSGEVVGFSGSGGSAGIGLIGGAFDFNGGYFTAAYRNGLTLQVLGLDSSFQPLSSVQITLNTSGPGAVGGSTDQYTVAEDGFIDFGETFSGVSFILFSTSGGRTAPGVRTDGPQFIVDDLSIILP